LLVSCVLSPLDFVVSVSFRNVVPRIAHGDQSVQRRFVVFFSVKLSRWVEVDGEIVGLLIVIVSLLLCEA